LDAEVLEYGFEEGKDFVILLEITGRGPSINYP
jgi:hypothetical protein